MRALIILSLLLFTMGASAHDKSPKPKDIIGTWAVSLYFAPGKPPSSTQMVITGVDGEKLQGTFYGTTFEVARARTHWHTLVFTLMTRDGSGPYLTSGTLGEDGKITGQTLSVGRDFLMAWDAVRVSAERL